MLKGLRCTRLRSSGQPGASFRSFNGNGTSYSEKAFKSRTLQLDIEQNLDPATHKKQKNSRGKHSTAAQRELSFAKQLAVYYWY